MINGNRGCILVPSDMDRAIGQAAGIASVASTSAFKPEDEASVRQLLTQASGDGVTPHRVPAIDYSQVEFMEKALGDYEEYLEKGQGIWKVQMPRLFPRFKTKKYGYVSNIGTKLHNFHRKYQLKHFGTIRPHMPKPVGKVRVKKMHLPRPHSMAGVGFKSLATLNTGETVRVIRPSDLSK